MAGSTTRLTWDYATQLPPSLAAMATTSAAHAAGLQTPAFDEAVASPDSYRNAVLFDGCQSVRDLVLAPPAGRMTIYNGRFVSRRTVESWMAVD